MSQIEEQESKLERSDIQVEEPSLRPLVANKLNFLNIKNTIEPEEHAMRSPIQSKGNRSRHKSDINKQSIEDLFSPSLYSKEEPYENPLSFHLIKGDFSMINNQEEEKK